MNIAIIGIGNMGKAIAAGLKKAYGAEIRIAGWDKFPEVMTEAGNGIEPIDPWGWQAAGFAPDALIMAVKPGDVAGLLGVVSAVSHEHKLDFLVISVAAGVSISSIRKSVGDGARVCRVMPNTPALIGEGMSAYALSENCDPHDARIVEQIFGACGKVVSVSESIMDAVTGVSGSGPAFVYSFIEALSEGGVAAGLSYKVAQDLAVQTVIGAAMMVRQTGEHPSVLRSRVMSPGGTTVRGLQALESGGFRSAVMTAVTEAAARSAQMSAEK
ncbi:MAG: pyrroline-5-carboxylate reductase [Chitinispirillia bacterium]|nr:pyrroline-5-carboxylate reductase [Chitinispirillia bacterium]MCL2268988.1 pyrroline-5-carboxylate reductase [Chitinispirillia bacterium]